MRIALEEPIVLRQVVLKGPTGSVSFDAMLDTGAGLCTASWAVLEAVGYDPATARRRQKLVTANGIIEVPVVMVQSLEVQDLVAPEIAICAHDLPESVNIRGLIGLNFLRLYKTTIDYPGRSLEIV